MTCQILLRNVEEDLKDSPIVQQACADIIDVVCSTKDKHSFRHLTYSSLINMANCQLQDEEVANVVRYLCGDRIQLLKLRLEYIAPELELSFILDDENSRSFSQEGAIAHPKTGQVIEDVENNIFVFFTLNESVCQ
ncbi:hypothetical protein [Psychrobium sp. 1_MG-2023]|uniref:hypothetical protein n=1 Tax=Psychrobium sp. 1_MG-2023 TaxID=3062624 RepID=UPI000C342A2E|nr:hypothetical protein [Psychrobium sp. 1_MG-2023]MDP2561411.1 hypothetical protein [Psychrobium sp. 1_MG-2023]PKF54890.1 hypothetical protein CW748_15195 [Alteromonadales bacterium alter-6D02]